MPKTKKRVVLTEGKLKSQRVTMASVPPRPLPPPPPPKKLCPLCEAGVPTKLHLGGHIEYIPEPRVCPFCYCGHVEIKVVHMRDEDDRFAVVCSECGAQGPMIKQGSTRTLAIHLWNGGR